MKLINITGITVITLTMLIGIAWISFSKKPFSETNQQTSLVEEVVVTPANYTKISRTAETIKEISSWKTFIQEKLKFSIQYPANVVLDERQTVQGKIYVFIFAEDQEASLSGKVTALYIADTGKKDIDGFSAFRKGDCGKECKISYKQVSWVNINNLYGIKNPLPGDIHNYYLTNKEQTESVINVYAGGYLDKEEKSVQEKIKIFEQMIQTMQFKK